LIGHTLSCKCLRHGDDAGGQPALTEDSVFIGSVGVSHRVTDASTEQPLRRNEARGLGIEVGHRQLFTVRETGTTSHELRRIPA
jgi:hypothetical protein